MRKIYVFLLLLGLFFILENPAYAAEWRRVASPNTLRIYIDASSVVFRKVDGHLIGWEKVIFEDLNERREMARILQRDLHADFSDFYCVISCEEFYVNNSMLYARYNSNTYYDSKGHVIYSSGDISAYSKYDLITSGSLNEAIFRALVSYAKVY